MNNNNNSIIIVFAKKITHMGISGRAID